jgi:hypothetical protein
VICLECIIGQAYTPLHGISVRMTNIALSSEA